MEIKIAELALSLEINEDAKNFETRVRLFMVDCAKMVEKFATPLCAAAVVAAEAYACGASSERDLNSAHLDAKLSSECVRASIGDWFDPEYDDLNGTRADDFSRSAEMTAQKNARVVAVLASAPFLNTDKLVSTIMATAYALAYSKGQNDPDAAAWEFAKASIKDAFERRFDGHVNDDDFGNQIAFCSNAMMQNDAVGQVFVFKREGGKLVMLPVDAEDLDLGDLQQYEMVLFDGGNSHGDRWKHVFYPEQRQHQYVHESHELSETQGMRPD